MIKRRICLPSTIPLALSAAALAGMPAPAVAQTLASQMEDLRRSLENQQKRIDAEELLIKQQQDAIEALKASIRDDGLAGYRGAGISSPQQTAGGAPLPAAPVGEAPREQRDLKAEVAAVPQEQGVLTPAGHLVYDPAFDYTQSAADRLVFRGFELIPGIQIGLIEASKVRRETMGSTLVLRYGLTSRLEIEGRVPFIHRYDRISVTQQRDQGIVRSISLTGNHIGDAEFALRYQLNAARGADEPIYVASLRVKTDTGIGPFDIGYDQFGVATGVATGSGFWGIQPGISVLLPSDPVVIFGGVNYLWNIKRNINKMVGGVLVGRVEPGDAISANLGFGFALNPRFSFSLGYSHNYIFSTHTEINHTQQRSAPLQVGSLNFGMSYRLTPRATANIAFQFGVTADAPNVGITFRLPFTF